MNLISVNQSIAPTSTVTVPGLFAVPGAPVKLADLVNGAGGKLGSLIPASALTVVVHSANNHGANFILEGDTLVPQSNCELSVADLQTHSIYAESPGDCVAIRYVRLMGDKE
jgi:hypothetical protein